MLTNVAWIEDQRADPLGRRAGAGLPSHSEAKAPGSGVVAVHGSEQGRPDEFALAHPRLRAGSQSTVAAITVAGAVAAGGPDGSADAPEAEGDLVQGVPISP